MEYPMMMFWIRFKLVQNEISAITVIANNLSCLDISLFCIVSQPNIQNFVIYSSTDKMAPVCTENSKYSAIVYIYNNKRLINAFLEILIDQKNHFILVQNKKLRPRSSHAQQMHPSPRRERRRVVHLEQSTHRRPGHSSLPQPGHQLRKSEEPQELLRLQA